MLETEDSNNLKIKFLESIPEYTGSWIDDDYKLNLNTFVYDTNLKTLEPFICNIPYKVVFAYLDGISLEENIQNFKDCLELYGIIN